MKMLNNCLKFFIISYLLVFLFTQKASAEEILLSLDNDNNSPSDKTTTGEVYNPEPSWPLGKYATGNWGPVRKVLEEHGIEIESNYTNDTFTKLRGINNGKYVKFVGLINYSVAVDTQKLKLWPGGRVYVLGQTIFGQPITSPLIGGLQPISSIEAPIGTQLEEAWYEQNILNKGRIKGGIIDAGTEFSTMESAANFVNSSFTLTPAIPMPEYPKTEPGILLAIEPKKLPYLKSAVFTKGLRFGVLGNTPIRNGVFTIVEGGIKPVIKNQNGKYAAGYWFHSVDLPSPTNLTGPKSTSQSSGFYTYFEQMVFKEKKKNKDDKQGLYIQGQFGWLPSDIHIISKFYSSSITYQGIIPKRDNDNTGFGVVLPIFAKTVQQTQGLKNESYIEWFYKFQLTKWLEFQPDVQYAFNPGGKNKNALVIGIRTILTF